MIGAIIGDIVGSRFEWDNHRSKDFDLLTHKCFFTDDSVMSLAVCDALLKCEPDYRNLSEQAVRSMQNIGRPYPHCGYGGSFCRWMYSDNPQPYNSYGNGAAMRVSGCGYVGNTIDEVKQLSKAVAKVTHNHPEGMKGAEATAVAVFLARTGKSLFEIQDYITKNYYELGFTLDSIRETYRFNETCQDTVPQALEAFFESTSFEDAIRNAISIGGDSDTIAAITGAVAEAYYGVPTDIRKHALTFLDERLLKILLEFENRYPAKIEKLNEAGSVSITPSTGKKVKTGGRSEMIESAMDVIDSELDASMTHPEETTSQKLFSHLFEACNILRGPINQDEYKSYVTPILFFKRLSDVYDEETQLALEESGGDEEYASFAENHRFVIPDGCHWQDVREASENVGVAIVNAMNGIERANPDSSGKINHEEVQYVAKERVSEVQLIKTGDILMCVSSGSLEHVGKAAICPSSIVGETFGAFCKLIRPKGSLLSEYIAAYLETDEYRKIIMQLACGSNINNLKTEHIDDLQIPVPPLDIQESFVAFVRQSDKSKFELEQALSELTATYKRIIKENLG